MATFERISGNAAPSVDGLNRKGVTVVRVNTNATALNSGDDWTVFRIPPRTIIQGIDVVSVQPQGAANTFSLGDSASAVQFGNALSANVAAGSSLPMNNFGMRKYYHNADRIRVTANSNLSNAIFDLFIHWEYVGEPVRIDT